MNYLQWLRNIFAGLVLFIAANVQAGDISDFDVFFHEFTESIEFQKSHTLFPLEKLIIMNAIPEPKEVAKFLTKEQIMFPVIKNEKEFISDGLVAKIEQKDISGNLIVVNVFKDDTGWQVLYIFKKDGAWKLVRIEDRSI